MTPQDHPSPAPGGAAPPALPADPTSWAHNSRLGLVLFFIYLALYLGFIGMSAFGRETMGKPAIGGVNVAVVYGFGLIFAAFALAVVYMVLCKPEITTGPEVTEADIEQKLQEEEGQA